MNIKCKKTRIYNVATKWSAVCLIVNRNQLSNIYKLFPEEVIWT